MTTSPDATPTPALRWGLLGYAVCLALVALLCYPYLADAAPRLFARGAPWSPGSIHALDPQPMTILFLLAPVLGFLACLGRWLPRLTAPGVAPLVLVRGLMAGLTLALYLGAGVAVRDARQQWDAGTRAAVARLRPGMTPAEAAAVLQASAPETFLQPASAEGLGPPRAFTRRYSAGFGTDDRTLFAVRLRYGPDGRLQHAGYTMARELDGLITRCELRAEVPAAPGKQYPVPCAAKVADE